MNDDNSLMDFIMRVGAMILLGVLLVSFAGFIFPVLGLLLLGACIYGYFYWRRIRRAVQQAQEQADMIVHDAMQQAEEIKKKQDD